MNLSHVQRLELHEEIFAEIKEILVECGLPMEGCPPAFYPEAIAKLRAFTLQATVDCQTFHKHTDMDTINACVLGAIPKLAESFEKLKEKHLRGDQKPK